LFAVALSVRKAKNSLTFSPQSAKMIMAVYAAFGPVPPFKMLKIFTTDYRSRGRRCFGKEELI
jgi:hypothetical protein